ncbi:hypothetical protein CCACVL1_08299 [Corchorus capsularis]|uniref:Uncharacterized protein n=1 Tax=Corchorus capsularis TaxID=210143 RepID=A0A1R3J185_COCAP|nr:hypothetical protein CCACVL1_08299 [Corchorus capsularis]
MVFEPSGRLLYYSYSPRSTTQVARARSS